MIELENSGSRGMEEQRFKYWGVTGEDDLEFRQGRLCQLLRFFHGGWPTFAAFFFGPISFLL